MALPSYQMAFVTQGNSQAPLTDLYTGSGATEYDPNKPSYDGEALRTPQGQDHEEGTPQVQDDWRAAAIDPDNTGLSVSYITLFSVYTFLS